MVDMAKKCIAAFLGFSLLYIIVGIISTASAQTPTPEVQKKRYVENQVVVKFKPDMSPQELQIAVNKRNQLRSSAWGSVQLMLSDLKYAGKEDEKPEARFMHIQNADVQSGAVKKKSLFNSASPTTKNTFLYTLNGKKSVDESVKIYSGLTEVEKAAPNYILRVMGIQSAPESSRYAENQVMIKFSSGSSPDDIQTAINARKERSLSTLGKILNSQEDTANFIRGVQTPERKFATLMATSTEAGVTVEKEIRHSNNVFVYTLDGSLSVPETVELFKSLGITAEVAPNYFLYLNKIPADPNYPKLWGLKNMNAESAWDITTGSFDVKAAVVDTGVDKNHVDLKDNVKIAKQINASGVSDCPADGSPSASHGTHVAGTIGAVGNSTGVVGVNWKVSILGYCVGSEDQITDADVSEGVNQAVADGAKVINMSLGGPDDPIGLRDAVNNAVSKNVTVVVSAGNCKNNPDPVTCPPQFGDDSTKYYPASYGNVITVSALGPSNTQAAYSSSGSNVDVAAPGGSAPGGCTDAKCILSTIPGGRYGVMQGTSMAAPHVTGAVALLLSLNPNLTPQQVQDILQQSADDLGASGKDPIYGYGRVNLKKAVDLVNGTTPPASSPLPTQGPTSPTPGSTTSAPTTATTQGPTPTSDINHPCPDKVKAGNYNCDNKTDNQDKEDFVKDFKANKTPLAPFVDWIRSALYN